MTGFYVSEGYVQDKDMLVNQATGTNTQNRTISPYAAVIDSPMQGDRFKIGIKCDADNLTAIDFMPASAALSTATTALAIEVIQQLQAYFSDPHYRFDLPIRFQGTEHQRRVWQALNNIPVGHPVYYSQLAEQLKSSARAIGGACRTNPTPIVIPCHRVIAKNGLGGFVGKTRGLNVEIKQWFLHHEA